jgi:hypothetical protein
MSAAAPKPYSDHFSDDDDGDDDDGDDDDVDAERGEFDASLRAASGAGGIAAAAAASAEHSSLPSPIQQHQVGRWVDRWVGDRAGEWVGG